VVVGVVEELVQRNGLRIALNGRDQQTLQPLVAFLARQITRPPYAGVLIGVANLLLDMYMLIYIYVCMYVYICIHTYRDRYTYTYIHIVTQPPYAGVLIGVANLLLDMYMPIDVDIDG